MPKKGYKQTLEHRHNKNIINDVKKQFIIFGNEEGGANSSSECPALPNQITEKGGIDGKIN